MANKNLLPFGPIQTLLGDIDICDQIVLFPPPPSDSHPPMILFVCAMLNYHPAPCQNKKGNGRTAMAKDNIGGWHCFIARVILRCYVVPRYYTSFTSLSFNSRPEVDNEISACRRLLLRPGPHPSGIVVQLPRGERQSGGEREQAIG